MVKAGAVCAGTAMAKAPACMEQVVMVMMILMAQIIDQGRG